MSRENDDLWKVLAALFLAVLFALVSLGYHIDRVEKRLQQHIESAKESR